VDPDPEHWQVVALKQKLHFLFLRNFAFHDNFAKISHFYIDENILSVFVKVFAKIIHFVANTAEF
jgi:hypothetical protein